MLLSTFNISQEWLVTIRKKYQEIGFIFANQTEKHDVRPLKYGEQTKKTVENHINSIPRVESHYVRAIGQREYFDEDLNLKKLYDMYFEWILINNDEDATVGSFRQYKEHFANQFNIGFFRGVLHSKK